MKRTYFITVIDGVFYVGRACDKQTRDTFQSSRLTGVRLWAVITLQTLWWETGGRSRTRNNMYSILAVTLTCRIHDLVHKASISCCVGPCMHVHVFAADEKNNGVYGWLSAGVHMPNRLFNYTNERNNRVIYYIHGILQCDRRLPARKT